MTRKTSFREEFHFLSTELQPLEKPLPVYIAEVLDVRVRFRWWLELYLHGVIFFAVLFDAAPDLAKVLRRVNAATVIEVYHRGRWKRMA